MAGKRKHYAVARGRSGPDIYDTWDECSDQVTGIRGAKYKAFKTRAEAEDFLVNEGSAVAASGIGTTDTRKTSPDTGSSFGAAVAAAAAGAYGASKGGNSGGAIIDLCSQDSSQTYNAGAGDTTASKNKRAKYEDDRKPAAASASSEPVDLCDDSSDEEEVTYKKSAFSASRGKKKGRGHGDTGSRTSFASLKTPNALQSKAIEAAKRGDNIFITGPAGTGKSVVLSHIMHHLRTKYRSDPNKFVAVAPTGPTAISVGGQTIHSFAGCGVPETSEDFEKVWKNKKKWRDLEVMVIEEISMISGEFFDRLSDVVCKVRGTPSNQPFGGIQLITCGDFLQLPPIPKSAYKVKAAKDAFARQGKSIAGLHQDRGFAFQSKAWRNAGLEVIQLDQVFRQNNNSFVSVLHEIRFGKVSQESAKYLERCNRPLPPKDGIEATKLYATNKDVTAENSAHLNKLPGAKVSFQAKDFAEPEDDAPGWAESSLLRNGFYRQCLAEAELNLKEGAQVMLIKNEQTDDHKTRLVNGSRGKVVGFTNASGKRGHDELDIEVEDDDPDDDGSYPIVQFRTGRCKVIRPERFESRIVGLGTCIRQAVPLKLAWAVTMHKSQGLTLDYVKADVGGVFTEAQAYVALSRATDEEGLELRNFSPRLVRADKRALAFYANPDDPTINRWDEPEDAPPVNAAPSPSFRSPNEASSSTAPPAAKANALSGIAFVLTGEEAVGYSRSAAEKLIKDCGGLVRGAVSGKTKYLVIGPKLDDGRSVQSSKKYQAAQTIMSGENKSGLKIIDKAGLFSLIRGENV